MVFKNVLLQVDWTGLKFSPDGKSILISTSGSGTFSILVSAPLIEIIALEEARTFFAAVHHSPVSWQSSVYSKYACFRGKKDAIQR
jgi:hypothetical protein